MTGSRGAAPLRRLLAVAVALVALVLGGLAAQGGSRTAGATGGSSVSGLAAPARAGTSATRPATTRAATPRSTVAQTHRDALVVQQSVDRNRATGVSSPVGVEPERPGTSAPLVLGQLPRPPSTGTAVSGPAARRGRAPPATAGT